MKQDQSFALAISTMRSRLGDTQSRFAERLGCKQNTISQYESGRIGPSAEILTAVWKLADQTERHLLRSYLSSTLDLMNRDEQLQLLRGAEELAKSTNLAGALRLARVSAKIEALYFKYAGVPELIELFELAVSWLEVELAMRTLEHPASPSDKKADTVEHAPKIPSENIVPVTQA